MKKTILILAALSALPLCAQESTGEEQPVDINTPFAANQTRINWYEIDPGVRKYLILQAANTMELSAELPDYGVSPTPEQQFDMMEQVIRRTPLDSLTGEYLQFVTEANELNFRIIASLRKEKPADHAGIIAISKRYKPEIDALCMKYPQAGRYFSQEAQMQIALALSYELNVQRVMMQASMAGKSRQEVMRTIVEHLRHEAEQQF